MLRHLLKNMSLKLESFAKQQEVWPQSGNHILAQYDDNSIVVYQAFNPKIAKSIVESQNYHSDLCVKAGVNLNRMTWVKPNFLWMMYRSGWATKSNQERILAIRITRDGFEEILAKAVVNSRSNDALQKSDQVRLQWDPDHLPNGDKVSSGRRAIQLGLRGEMFSKLSKEFIVNISDVTDMVLEQSKNISNPSELMIPLETVYSLNKKEISQNIQLD